MTNRQAAAKAKWAAMSPSQRLEARATKLLAKHGFYPKRGKRDDVVVEAEAIGQNGRLRPTWTGRP